MIKFELHEEIDEKVANSLRQQGIGLNRFYYILFVDDEYAPDHFKQSFFSENNEVQAISHHVEELLNPAYPNKWYYVHDFMGRKGVIGVSYHA